MERFSRVKISKFAFTPFSYFFVVFTDLEDFRLLFKTKAIFFKLK